MMSFLPENKIRYLEALYSPDNALLNKYIDEID